MKIKNQILHLLCFILLSSVGLFAQLQNEESKTSPLMMFRVGEAKKEAVLGADPDLRSRRAQDEVANEVSREAGASQQEKVVALETKKVAPLQKEGRRNALFLWVKEALMSGGESLAKPIIQAAMTERLLREEEIATIEKAIESAPQQYRAAFTGYQEADTQWMKAAEGWQRRSEAQRKAATYEEQLVHSRTLLQQEKAIREATNPKKTKLGKLSRYTGKAAGVLSFVNTPFVTPSGVLATVSAVADQANKYQINASYRGAKRVHKKVAKASSKASEAYQLAMSEAPELEGEAEERERNAKKELVQQTIKLAQSLKPPAPQQGIEHWNKWSDVLTGVIGLDSGLSKILAFHGMSNVAWAHGVTARGWKRQLELSQERLTDLEEEQTEAQRRAQQLYQEFERSKKANEVIEQKIKQIKEKQAQLAGRRDREKKILEEENEALSQLDGSNPVAVEEKRRLIRAAITALKKRTREWEQYKNQAEEEKQNLERELAEVTTASAKLLEEYFAQEKSILRKQDRAKMEAMTDEILWKALWPDQQEKSKKEKIGDLGNVVQKRREFFQSLSKKRTQQRGEQTEATEQQKEFLVNIPPVELIRPALIRVEESWENLATTFSKQDEIINAQKQYKEYESLKKEIIKAAEHANERTEEASTFIKGVTEGKDEIFGNIFHHVSDAARCIAIIAKGSNAAQVEPYLKTVVKSAKSALAESDKLKGSPWEEEAAWGASLAQDAVEMAKQISPQGKVEPATSFAKSKKKEVTEQTSEKIQLEEKKNIETTLTTLVASSVEESSSDFSKQEDLSSVNANASEEKKIESAFLLQEEAALSVEKGIVLEVRQIATQVKANLLDQEAADIAEEKKLMEGRERLAQEEKKLMATMEVCTTKDETVLESIMLLQEVIEQEKEVIEKEEAVLAEREILREELREELQIQEEEIQEQQNVILEEEQQIAEQLQKEEGTILEEKKERVLKQTQEEEEQQKIEEELRQRAIQQAEELAVQKEAEVAAREKALEENRVYQEKLAGSKEASQKLFYEKALASLQAEERALQERKNELLERERRIEEREKAKAARKAVSLQKIQDLKRQLEAIEEEKRQLAEREAALKKAEEEESGDDVDVWEQEQIASLLGSFSKESVSEAKLKQKSEETKKENSKEGLEQENPSPVLLEKKESVPKLSVRERLRERMEKNKKQKQAEEESVKKQAVVQGAAEKIPQAGAFNAAKEVAIKEENASPNESPRSGVSLSLQQQISQWELQAQLAYQKVEQGEGTYTGEEQREAIKELVTVASALLDLQFQVDRERRYHDYEENSLPLTEKEARETALITLEQANKEKYLQWLALLPQGKRGQFTQQTGKYADVICKVLTKTIEAERAGKMKEAMLCYKSVTCYQRANVVTQQEVASALGDWKGAASYYSKAAEAEKKENSKVAECYLHAGRICELKVKALEAGEQALAQKDKSTAILQEEIAKTLGGYWGGVECYQEAAEALEKGYQRAVQCYIKAGRAREVQAEALACNDRTRAALQKKIVEALGRYNQINDSGMGGSASGSGAASFYSSAVDLEKKGNQKAAQCYTKAGEAREAEAEAVIANDEAGVKLQQKIAEVLGSAAYYYGYALGNEKEGKVVEYYTQAGRACERQAKALVSNNETEVILQKEMAEALSSIASYYREMKDGEQNVVECYTQAVKAREMQLEALAHEDHAMAILYKELATTLAGYTSKGLFAHYVDGAASYYKKAIQKKRSKEQKEAEQYDQQGASKEKRAKALQDYLEALAQNNPKAQEMQNRIVATVVLGGDWIAQKASSAYINAAVEQSQEHPKLVEYYIELGRVHEAQLRALKFEKEAAARNDQATAREQKKIAAILGGCIQSAADCYEEAIGVEKEGYHKAAECHMKAGRARELQAEAVMRHDYSMAALQKTIVEALGKYNEIIQNEGEGGGARGSGAASCYARAAKAEKEEHQKASESYTQAGKACELQAEAIIRNDKAAAVLQKEISGIFGGITGNAASCYENAFEQEKKGNVKIADCYNKAAKARELQVAALEVHDRAEAEKQKNIATELYQFASFYNKALTGNNGKNQQANEYCGKAERACELHLEALVHGDQNTAVLQKEIAEILLQAAHDCREADRFRSFNSEAAECCTKAAKARENQAEALIANNQAVAALQKKIAELLGRDSGGSAFYYYKQAGWADNRVQAQSYREQAQEKEAEAARLQESVDALPKNH